MAAEHATKIYTVSVIGIVIVIAVLAFTSIGHVIDAATQHFMLYYAGVFALIGLCASVGLGFVATDRMFLHPGQRVFIQAAHRAASFGAVSFLIIHIVTEILAQRVHVIDSVVPFLSPFRTFYIGLGTIASDLIILLVITGIMRGRFNASGKAWRWRAIHYTSYVALVFGVWHGLLGGRPGKPYVDWSYGFVIAFVLLGLAVRVLSNGLRPKENLSAPPVEQAANSASAPLRAAAMLAQYGGTRVGKTAIMGGSSSTGAQPMLAAPVTATVLPDRPALPAGDSAPSAQPFYEPGYEGPPRYLGAPRDTGPRQRPQTGPMPRPATGPMPRATGSMPRATTGSMPRVPTGPTPVQGSGPIPRGRSGPMPGHPSGPFPRADTGSFPRADTGSFPRADTGSFPRPDTGPRLRPTDPMPRHATGSFPAAPPPPPPPPSWTGPMPSAATGGMPQLDDDWGSGPRHMPPGPAPRGPAGPPPRGGTGPVPVWDDPRQRPPTGPMPTMPMAQPQAGRRPEYQEWPEPGYDQAWQEPGYDQGWLEASHDEGGYYEQPPWDGYLPESDPDPRYREPGPGMPGYRGSREHRYGGDRY